MSLTEAMITLIAGLAVIGAAFQGLTHFQQRLATQHRVIGRTQDMRLGLQVLKTELRLAGIGMSGSAQALLKADEQEIEFHANLAGLTTTLTQAASAGQQELSVDSGSDWSKGKRIVICAALQCAEYRLARDGRAHGLSLTSPLAQAFPIGSAVSVSNQVRYYLQNDSNGRTNLLRMVDGGANTLIGEVGHFRLSYLGKEGELTDDPARVSLVRVELGAEGGGWIITREVGLRGS